MYIVYQVFVLPVCALCCLCSNFSVVEASEFSKDSFFSWVKGAFLHPSTLKWWCWSSAKAVHRLQTEVEGLGNGSARGDSEVGAAERAEGCCKTGVLMY